MDIVAAARTYLAQQYDVVSLIGYDDQFYTETGGWIFQSNLLVQVEGSSVPPYDLESRAVAVLLDHRGNWTSPNEHNTMAFPRLLVEIYADPDRDDNNNVIDELSAKDKILPVYEAIDKHFHRTSGASVWWGPVRVLRSTRLGEPIYNRVPDGDGLIRAQVYYGLGVG